MTGPSRGRAVGRLRLPHPACGSRLRHLCLLLAADPECIGSPADIGRIRHHAGSDGARIGLEPEPYDGARYDGEDARRPRPTGSLGPKDQEIKFCRAQDGVRLAYAIHGSGPPLVVASCWLSHLQYDWQSPVWRHFLDQLGALATVVRYDERGFGMSDWTVDDFSLEARLADLEAILAAAGLERFALLGMSGGSAVAMAYAIAHPERVTRLILHGTVCGEPVTLSPEALVRGGDLPDMIRVGWAKEDADFRRVFTTQFIPDATEQQMRWFDDLQRMSTSPANAVASRIARQQVDIEDDLPRITRPTLVLQASATGRRPSTTP